MPCRVRRGFFGGPRHHQNHPATRPDRARPAHRRRAAHPRPATRTLATQERHPATRSHPVRRPATLL